MSFHSWTWIHLALAIAGYWIVVIAAWRFYATRPAHQARAREEAITQRIPGSRPGEETVVLSGTVNLTGVLAVLLGPPVLLVVAWLAL